MKKTAILKALVSFTFIATLFVSCQKGKIDPYNRQFKFLANYKKPTASITSAQFDIDRSSLPKAIQVPNQTPLPATCQVNRVCMTITNVRLKDELGIYDIHQPTDVVTEEMRNGKWEQDVENKLTLTKTQNLDIVLVLDYSSSLGSDIAKVKSYAATFIDYIRTQNSGAKVGIVTFSNTINALPLTNNYNTATSFINSQPSGADETRLYEAMDKGITLLQNSTAEGKALVTFTDGKNNSWMDPSFQTFTPVVTRLRTAVGNPSTLIASYTIGLNGKQGGVDEDALNALAMNEGISAVAPDADKLSRIFSKFASSVSAIYTMTYNRNSSIITDNIQLRFVVNTVLQ